MRTGRQASLAALATSALIGAGCGGEDSTEPRTEPFPSGGAAIEAAPEAEPQRAGSPEPGELEPSAREQVEAAVRRYVAALNARRGDAVCARFAAQGRPQCERLARRGIGSGGAGGTPAWKRTTIRELESVAVGEETARVTATVTHDFADRAYVSLEEDVIYLVLGPGGEWLLAKPSGSLYRAVGFPEPPLRALTPP